MDSNDQPRCLLLVRKKIKMLSIFVVLVNMSLAVMYFTTLHIPVHRKRITTHAQNTSDGIQAEFKEDGVSSPYSMPKTSVYKPNIGNPKFVPSRIPSASKTQKHDHNSKIHPRTVTLKSTDKNRSRSEVDGCTAEFKSTHLVTSRISARTGNNIFQISAMVAAADDACYTPVIDPNTIDRLTNIFHIRGIEFRDVNVSSFVDIVELGSGKYSGPIWMSMSSNENWRVVGFRQSYKYFQHKQGLVRSTFVYKEEIINDVERFFVSANLTSKTNVGLHVRRGDFGRAQQMASGFFPSGLEYILRAVRFMKNLYGDQDLAFVIVSDDKDWCRENLKFQNAYFSPFRDVGRDLLVLNRCDHNIVTTGTFGWMGAWLNETGTVTYDKSFPRKGSRLAKSFNPSDYYPYWWIGL